MMQGITLDIQEVCSQHSILVQFMVVCHLIFNIFMISSIYAWLIYEAILICIQVSYALLFHSYQLSAFSSMSTCLLIWGKCQLKLVLTSLLQLCYHQMATQILHPFHLHSSHIMFFAIVSAATWTRVSVWLVIGVLVYAFYGHKHSSLRDAVYVPAVHADEIYRSSGHS